MRQNIRPVDIHKGLKIIVDGEAGYVLSAAAYRILPPDVLGVRADFTNAHGNHTERVVPLADIELPI